jgi:hypothetical protein
MDLEDKIVIKFPDAECKVFENTTFDLVYSKYICTNRKGNAEFKCQYLESNHFIIRHFCTYRK